MDARHDVWELSRFLTELSVIDYFFVIHKPSSVAVAALLNSMDEVLPDSQEVHDEFLSEVSKVAGLDPTTQEVVDCRNRLRLLYAQGGYSRPTATEERNETVSPVCVSYGVNPNAYPARADSASTESKSNRIARSSSVGAQQSDPRTER